MKKIFLMVIAITTIACSCKKYEEGPLISFRSAKNRLYGEHTLVKYTINGEDSLQKMKERFGLIFEFFHDDYGEADALHIYGDNIVSPFISQYHFSDHKKNIYLDYGSILLVGYGSIDPHDIEFKILKLKKNEIHFKTNYNNKEYYFELN